MEILAAWLDEEGRVPATDAPARVAELEARYGVRLPEDFRRYLLEVAPASEVFEVQGIIWWDFGRIRSLPEEYEHAVRNPAIAAEAGAYLFFADYLIWCWAWAICCSDGPNRGRVALIGGPDAFVADSFTGFVEGYLRDPDGMTHTGVP